MAKRFDVRSKSDMLNSLLSKRESDGWGRHE